MKKGKKTKKKNKSDYEWSGTEDEEEANLLLGLLYDSDLEFDYKSAEANLMIPTGDPDSPSLLKWHEDSSPLPTPPTVKRASKDRKRKASNTDHGLEALKKAKYEELLALQDKPTTSRKAADLSAKIKAFKELNDIPEETPEDVRRTTARAARVSARVRVKSAQPTEEAAGAAMKISESQPTEEAEQVELTAAEAAWLISESLAESRQDRVKSAQPTEETGAAMKVSESQPTEEAEQVKLTVAEAARLISETLAESRQDRVKSAQPTKEAAGAAMKISESQPTEEAEQLKLTAAEAAWLFSETLAKSQPTEEAEQVKLTASEAALQISETLAESRPTEEARQEKAIILSLEEIEPINLIDDFEQDIDKDSMKPRTPRQPASAFTPDSGWQGSFVARLAEFEDIIDRNMTEVTEPGVKKPRTMSVGNWQRPWAPPSPRTDLSVGNKLSKMYCTLQLHSALSLEMVASALGNAVFNRDIGVVQKRYLATQIAWIWADGTIMIVNGSSRAMLAETLAALMAKIGGQANFKADASNDLQMRRTTAHVEFPFQIDMEEFTAAHSLSSRLLLNEMHYVYYVDKEMPGVAARVFGTGWIQVFSMSNQMSDQMLTKLYYLTGNYKKD